MSNRANIETVKFKRWDDKEKSIGLIVSDDYGHGILTVGIYDDSVNVKDDMDILRYCKNNGSEADPDVMSIIDSLLENEKGMRINNTWYDWSEIKHIFDE